MKVAIMTDTNSGIFVDEAKKLGIYCMPMPIVIDQNDYIEDVNLSHTDFLNMLSEGKEVSTSQPSPGEIMDMWESIFADGYDEIVYIPMSSGLSSSASNAIGYADDYEGKVFVADNHRISVTLKQAVLDAVVLVKEGKSGSEIKTILEDMSYDSIVYLIVDTLEYLKKTGRVNSTAATVGSVLNIKPVLKTTGGTFEVCNVLRGSKKIASKLVDLAKEEINSKFENVPHDELVIGVASSYIEKDMATPFVDAIVEAIPDVEVFYSELSCSIASHTGPNAIGIGISRKIVTKH